MKIFTHKIADVSTGHITKFDATLMLSEDGGAIAQICGGRGTMFCVPPTDDLLEAMSNRGYSPNFLAILEECRRQKIQYIRFDADGAEIPGVQSFDW